MNPNWSHKGRNWIVGFVLMSSCFVPRWPKEHCLFLDEQSRDLIFLNFILHIFHGFLRTPESPAGILCSPSWKCQHVTCEDSIWLCSEFSNLAWVGHILNKQIFHGSLGNHRQPWERYLPLIWEMNKVETWGIREGGRVIQVKEHYKEWHGRRNIWYTTEE